MPIYGPYDRGYGAKRYRVVIDTGGKQRAFSFATLAEAKAKKRQYEREAHDEASDRDVSVAMREFLETRYAKLATRTTNRYRLRGLLRLDEGDIWLHDVTPGEARRLYTKRVQETAGDTHIAELSLVALFWDWCAEQGYVRGNPWLDIPPQGSKQAGQKQQPRVDEARKLVRVALDEGSTSGLAVCLALYLGLRATEVTSRVVRDLDDGGSLLWVPSSKTPSGVRQMAVPLELRAALLALTVGKKPTENLWGANERGKPVDRHWLHHHVERLCKAAKIPVVTTHALRGLHATLATVNQVSVDAVSRALGHAPGSNKVARRHYIAAGAEADANTERLADRLRK